MYDFNHKPEHWDIKSVGYYRENKKSDIHAWGGGRTRRLLQAAYTFAFLCLLRFDEVLKIQMNHIEIVSKTHIKLMLPFRKTHQFGGISLFGCLCMLDPDGCSEIKPFHLYLLPEEEAHLCPVRALAEWLVASQIQRGFLFRRMYAGDRIADLEQNTPMVGQHTAKTDLDAHPSITDLRAVLGTVPQQPLGCQH
jgi:hypothetical protein